MKINSKFLPIKLHYFLRYSATASLVMFLPVIIRQKGIPPQGIGLLWTVLPFIALFTSSISGGLADAFKIHREIFLSGLICLTLGMCGVYFLPSLQDTKEPLQNASYPYDKGGSFIGEANYSDFETGLMFSHNIGNDIVVLESELSSGHGEAASMSAILEKFQFWLIFGCLLIEQLGLKISVIFTDAVCFKILGSKHEYYGKQRMWGTIGMGVFSLIMGALIDWYSAELPQQDFFPAFVVCTILMCLDILLVSRMAIPVLKKERMEYDNLKLILKCPKTILFLMMVAIYGFSCGINWTFRLLLVEDVALEYDPNFGAMKLLLGLIMTMETFGGELPFLFFSGYLIKKFGHVAVFVICLHSISLRYFLYFALSNPWLYLLVEILNGPAYGLFEANMVSYGTEIAPTGTLATVQAIIRASFSAGQCSGGLIGGVIYDASGGRRTFLVTSLIVFGFTVLYGAIQLVSRFSEVLCARHGEYVKPTETIQEYDVEESSPNARNTIEILNK